MQRILSLGVLAVALVSCSDDTERRPADIQQQPVEVARADTDLVSVDDSTVVRVLPEEEQTPVRLPPEPPREPAAAPAAPPEPADTQRAESAPADTRAPPAAPPPAPEPADSAASSETAPVPPSPPVRTPDTVGTARPVPPRAPPITVPEPSEPGRRGTAVTIPAGTELHASMVDSIHSRHDSAGGTVTARVMDNVRGPDGRTVVPAGALVRLTIVRLAPAKSRGAEDGELVLRVEEISRGADTLAVTAEVQPVAHELRGRGVTGSEAAKVGAGAAAGAIAGRVLGGDTRGAVIGGVVGAAGGAAVAAETADRDVVVKAGTPITFVLTTPLVAARP